MKKIGKGWQYTVFEIKDDRVRKVFNNKRQSIAVMLVSCFPYFNYPFYKFSKFYKEVKRKAEESIKWIKQLDINLELFANPIFIKNLDYEQDKVIPVHYYIKKVSIKEIKKIIIKFVILNKYFLKIGFIDKSFNFCKNFGVNNKGDLVLIDLGELIIDKNEIIRQLKKRPWSSLYVNRSLPKQIRSFFIKEMDKNFIEENKK